MIDLDNLTALLKLAKEHGVSRLDLSSVDGAPVRIEFLSTPQLPQLVEFVPGELPKDGTTEPSPVESAALRLAGRAKKAGAK